MSSTLPAAVVKPLYFLKLFVWSGNFLKIHKTPVFKPFWWLFRWPQSTKAWPDFRRKLAKLRNTYVRRVKGFGATVACEQVHVGATTRTRAKSRCSRETRKWLKDRLSLRLFIRFRPAGSPLSSLLACVTQSSLQNRRKFLRFLGEQRQKRTAREGRSQTLRLSCRLESKVSLLAG